MSLSVFDMIARLKTNNSMIGGGNTFGKLKAHLENKVNYQVKYQDKPIDAKELAEIKAKIRQEIRAERKRNTLILIGVAVITIMISALVIKAVFFTKYHEIDNRYALEKESNATEAENKYEFYLKDGFDKLDNNDFRNAHYQFNLALSIKPDNYRANLGFTLTQLKKCYIEKVDCKPSEKQLTEFLSEFNNDSNIRRDMYNYVVSYGDTLTANRILGTIELGGI